MGIRAHIVLALCVMLSAARVAPAAVLSAGQLLRVTFNTTPGVPVPDTLSLHLGIVQVLAAHTSRTGALYDGNALLGTGTSTSFGGHVGALSLQPARSWRSPTSLYTFENPAVADFTSIVAGTIDGRVDFAISTGAMDINLDNVRLTLGQSTGPSSQLLTNPQPTITSVQIIPEPAVAAPAAAALLLGLRRRARAR